MVAVKTYEADRFLARQSVGLVVFLVHGSDAGLVNERCRSIARSSVSDANDPFQLVRMDGDDIAADPLKLVDEANSIGLFGGKRAIWIQAGSRSFISALEMLLDVPPVDCVIVVEAGSLKRDAQLRKLCESRKNAVSIECYPDSLRDLEQLVEREMSEAGLAIDRECRDVLVHLLGVDRLSTRSELAKLRLFAHGRSQVSVDDVRAVIADASGLAGDDVVNAAFSGDLAQTETVASHVFSTGGNGSALLGMALRHAVMLHRICLDIEGGMTAEQALERTRRSPSGKAIAAQVRVWTSIRLARAIDILAMAVGRARREPDLGEEIATRAFWTVARMVRPGMAG